MTVPRPLLSDYRVVPWCQIGVGDTRIPAGQARWDVSRWDDPDALWAGTEPTWLDVSCYVNAAESAAGRDSITDRFRVGTAEVVVVNDDGWADMLGPIDPAALVVRPGRQIRYGVTTATGTHLLARGFIDEAVPRYQPYASDVVDLFAIDALGEAGRQRLDQLAGPVGQGETVDVRIARTLDALNWPATYRDLQASGVPLNATTFGQSGLDLLGQAADSAAGSVFADLAGRICYRPRDWQTYPPGTPPAATIGNVDPGDVCPSSWELSWRRQDVAGVVSMRRPDGTGVTVAADYVTLSTMGPEPFERNDLLTVDDGTLAVMARRITETRSVATMPRVGAVTLDAATDPGDGSVVELMATARPETPTRLRCRLVERAGRPVFDTQMFVTGVAHTITDTGRWTCRLTLDAAGLFAADHGRWDAAGWDRATWSVAV